MQRQQLKPKALIKIDGSLEIPRNIVNKSVPGSLVYARSFILQASSFRQPGVVQDTIPLNGLLFISLHRYPMASAGGCGGFLGGGGGG